MTATTIHRLSTLSSISHTHVSNFNFLSSALSFLSLLSRPYESTLSIFIFLYFLFQALFPNFTWKMCQRNWI
uniref:Uncharacterized protein n=1 Tax=Vitis vinifera TaxID=29760 RepID=F6HCF9_VITVI